MVTIWFLWFFALVGAYGFRALFLEVEAERRRRALRVIPGQTRVQKDPAA